METVLILYAICASALVIWSTLSRNDRLRQRCSHPASKSRIHYVAIPSFLLHEWEKCYPDLVIFDLRTDNDKKAWHEDIAGSLTVSKSDLPNLLKWLPPKSTVVLSCGDGIEHFHTQTEGALLQLGIETIYLLDRGVNFPLTVTWDERRVGRTAATEKSRSNRQKHSLRGDKR
jgi:hypothetical protein